MSTQDKKNLYHKKKEKSAFIHHGGKNIVFRVVQVSKVHGSKIILTTERIKNLKSNEMKSDDYKNYSID